MEDGQLNEIILTCSEEQLSTKLTLAILSGLSEDILSGLKIISRVAEQCTCWLRAVKITSHYVLPTSPEVIIMYTTHDRKGCDQEKRDIEESLQSWSSVDPTVLKDPTRLEFMTVVKEAHNRKLSALIVVIMSHGRAGYFETKDGEINIQYFLDHVLYSEKTKDVPKVLLNSQSSSY